jgi:hypothetical protein
MLEEAYPIRFMHWTRARLDVAGDANLAHNRMADARHR